MDAIRPHLSELADAVQGEISFGIGRKNESDDAPTGHPLFDSPAWGGVPKQHREGLREKARSQLGTVGSGNHYVDVFEDSHGEVWIGVHFGSRGFGHTVASGFLALSQDQPWGKRAPEKEALLDLDSPMGDAYWQLMRLAGEYAYAGREWVARKVLRMIGGEEVDLIHNHHNFAWEEEHEGESFIVVRKGATPAFPGQRGFVGGSMGDVSVILEGVESKDAAPAMYSTVHGAGRVMSRTEAKGKTHRKTGRVIRPGKVTPDMMTDWLNREGVILRGGGLDESPHAYRRLPDVLRDQGDTIRVLHVLHPRVVVMAGANEFDPYKD